MTTKQPFLTYILIGICAVVAFASELGDNREIIGNFLISEYYRNGQNFLPEVMAGEFWRLITPIFIHFSVMHIAFNSLWLWDLGGVIEQLGQPWKLGAMVFGIGLVSNLAQYMFSGPMFGGMSGVVYGLLGYVWAQGKFNPFAQVTLHSQIMIMMLIWFVLCWTGILGPIANMAHTVGLVAGVFWGWLEATLAVARSKRNR